MDKTTIYHKNIKRFIFRNTLFLLGSDLDRRDFHFAWVHHLAHPLLEPCLEVLKFRDRFY